jgi:catechol 2,3-dioxygenase-like lactoylglutathione lyase family enzyme
MDFRLELVLIPVSDVDRAKRFYTEQAGFGLLVDTPVGDEMRIVQVTPPGSACSIGFGTGLGLAAAPGSFRLCRALSGSLVFRAISHNEPRLSNAARRKPGVGRSQTA